MKVKQNIFFRLMFVLVFCILAAPFVTIQFFYWLITGKSEKRTWEIAEYLFGRIEESDNPEKIDQK